MPDRVTHPAISEASYRSGMEHARKVMAEVTAEIINPDACRILTIAFSRLNDEINRYAGKIVTGDRIDYLERVQLEARQGWLVKRSGDGCGSTRTPLGVLSCRTWMEAGKDRWQSLYMLAGEPITVREIKALGLAQRPTTRDRKK